ncbi:MAG: hypothetical protein JO187_02530 [Acidobacteria bacterium]|nr:hypothetical protein [Acidobacteriota bacterium]
MLLAVALLVTSIGCGGGNNSATAGSHLAKRAFVSNDQTSTLQIIDATKDVNSGFTISVGSRPGPMFLSNDKKFTLVFSRTTNLLQLVDNSTETGTASVTLQDLSDSFVLLSDGKTAFAAVRNVGVDVIDFSTATITSTIAGGFPKRVVLSHNGAKLLVFPDPTGNQDSITVIDTASKAATATITGFSRPVYGVFSSDDSKAYVMNCGPECGGAAADASGNTSVSTVDLTTTPPTITQNVVVAAATVGLLDSSNLYVAGTPPGANCGGNPAGVACGRLSVVNTSTMTVSTSGVVITDGYHDRMELGTNNRLYVGARTCTNIAATGSTAARGCLSIFNSAAGTAVVPATFGDVTGLAPIAGRDVVYVIQTGQNQNGELEIFNTGTDALQSTQVDIVGNAIDVKDIE